MQAMWRSRMRVCLVALLLVPFGAAPLSAQANVAGEWAVSFATPMGMMEFTMAVSQSGTKLTGHMTSDVGEFPLKGTVDGDQVTIDWTLNDNNKMVDITFKGKVEGDKMSGTAKLGTIGQGPFSAERTSS
jgi:hypothetical protein